MDLITKIIQALDEIRPSILSDGGDISFVEFKDGVVYVKLHGACSSCPISSIHLKMGIEMHIREKISEVTELVAVD